MENRNIIIILVVIVVILAAVVGFMALNSTNAKQPAKVKITSDKEQYEGGKLSIQLTDLNRTPISKEVVNVTITNSKGKVVVDDVVKTNSKGKAELDLDLKKGKYEVNATYGGNNNFTGNSSTQKLIIEEKEVKSTKIVQESYDSSGSPVPGVSESDYNDILRSSHGDADLAKKRAEAYHRDGVI